MIGDATDAEKIVANAGAEMGTEAFISSPATRKKWRSVERAAGNGFLWTDENEVIGKPAYSTPNVIGDLMIYGSWADLLIVLFSVIEISRDSYTGKKCATTNIHVELLADLGPLRPLSFVRSTDSAAI